MTENKFKIILADHTTMREKFPLERQQELVNQSESGLFFVEAQSDAISASDVEVQINEWNKDNIIAILLHGLIAQELANFDDENSKTFGVPVMRVDTKTNI